MNTQSCQTQRTAGCSIISRCRTLLPQIAESFWFCLAFVLFLLLGPFSAIVVLIGVGSLASEKYRDRMTEPAHL